MYMSHQQKRLFNVEMQLMLQVMKRASAPTFVLSNTLESNPAIAFNRMWDQPVNKD